MIIFLTTLTFVSHSQLVLVFDSLCILVMFSVQQACIMMIKGMFFYFKTCRAVSGVELKNFSIFPDEEEV